MPVMPIADLPPMAVAERLPKVRAALADAACDALVVSNLVNIRYLTGFTGSNAVLLVRPDDLLFVTDGRYDQQSREQLAAAGVDADIEITREPNPVLGARARGLSRIGLEADSISWSTYRRYGFDVFPWAQLIPTSGLVEALRAVKDEGEVARLQAACAIADAALAAVTDRLDEGLTERGFARALEDAMAEGGSSGPSFETIVASGPNGAMPHARPTERVIGSSGKGELVVIDFGATVDGYHSDMTRTLAVGALSSAQRRMVEVVAEAQAAGRAMVVAGEDTHAVDQRCREIIDQAGWADSFSHGTGHGIGLVIHEDPRLSPQTSSTLEVGHCVTVEPGVYLPEHGGVRIEDSLVVTEDGNRVLTGAPYSR